MGKSLFTKVWELHKVQSLSPDLDQLFIGLHLIHEVTSPQAFHALREKGIPVMYPDRTVATVDHIVPTDDQTRPFQDELAEEMMKEIEKNTEGYGIRFYGLDTQDQGIVHTIGPELGLTQPGMTIACGDSHTSTHGAMGAIAFGIGTSQVRDVLATQTLALQPLRVRKIDIQGSLGKGVFAKDVILKIIADLGVMGGLGYAYEYAGPVLEAMSVEERLTICNMSIEGGARVGYVNPDETTFEYLRGKPFSPKGADFEIAVDFWKSIASDPDAEFDDVYTLDMTDVAPMVTWGINPGQGLEITQPIPRVDDLPEHDRETAVKALSHMGFSEGQTVAGQKIDVAFIGSCTNGRISDLRIAADVVRGKKVSPNVHAVVVPGSMRVKAQAEEEGLHEIFQEAGLEWREAGCSMCLAMNPDRLLGRQLCASSSNRNFIGRQGSPTGRTLLMSPAMVAAAAVAGEVVDVREMLGE